MWPRLASGCSSSACALELLTTVLVINLAGIFFLLIGVALISPLLTMLLMRLLMPVLGRLFGVIGRMSARGVVNSISRTAIAIASLMVAVSVIIGLAKHDRQLPQHGGVLARVVSHGRRVYFAADQRKRRRPAPSTRKWSISFATLPGVGDVTMFRRCRLSFRSPRDAPGRDAWQACDTVVHRSPMRERAPRTFVWTARPSETLWASMQGQDEVQVSEPLPTSTA